MIQSAKLRRLGLWSFFAYTTAMTDAAIGYIIMVVAVLLSHMLMKPVARIKPKIILFPPVPVNCTMERAMRLWRFHFSMPKPIMNPPMNRKITSLAYGAAVSLILEMPNKGKSTSGIMDTAGIGMASVIHHVIIRTAVANTRLAM